MRFRQVITNLLGNAPKFTHKGEIEISLDVQEESDDQIMLHTRIRDTGIGIPADKLDAIFEPFQQADGSTTRKYGGTGLGLSICRQLAKLMGGETWVESELDKGSTFHFTAWLHKATNVSVHRVPPIQLAGKRALVVDDHPGTRHIIQQFLTGARMQTVSLENGKEALAALQKASIEGHPFDIGSHRFENAGHERV